jgi:hypothetical protein
MTAWVRYHDAAFVSIDQSYTAGHNYKNNRAIWHGLEDITFGGGVGSQWYRDTGPKGLDAALLEPRQFALHGTASFSFSGTTLILRLNVAPSWATTSTTLTIDGVAPSTLSLLTYRDTVSCDALDYGLLDQGYVDVIVADGLANTTHSVVITANSPDLAHWFSMAGFKVGIFAEQTLVRQLGWVVPATPVLGLNKIVLSLTNRSVNALRNVSLAFPTGLVAVERQVVEVIGETNIYGDVAIPGLIPAISVATLNAAQTLTQTLVPDFAGTEASGTTTYYLSLAADYPDAAGTIPYSTTYTALPGDPLLTVSGPWYSDADGAIAQDGTTRLPRTFTATDDTTDAPCRIAFTFTGDTLTITIATALTWGTFGLYASDNTTLLRSVSCNVNDPLVTTVVWSGFGAGSHSVILRKVSDGLTSTFVVLVSLAWTLTSYFTRITETVTLQIEGQQPYALPVEAVSIGSYDVSFAPVIVDVTDYLGTKPRRNANIAYTEVLARRPSFAVFYQSGQADLLSAYDILIIDPFAAHSADVLAWQAKGIKVFGYISSGEESGVYLDRYDFTSELGPWRGDGSGPGGFAPWYMYTKYPTTGPPDRDGVWAAFFCNPTYYGPRMQSFYAPLVLGGPQTITNETVTTHTATITSGSVIVFDVAHTPVDSDETITLTTADGSHTYTIYTDYTFDTKTGAFVLSTAISPAVTSGDQLKISYTRKGHHCDGVFFDTVDIPDDYGPPDVGGGMSQFGWPIVAGYADAFAAMINSFAAAFPSAKLISNRGFTILPQIIHNMDGVMFESWLTLPDDIDNLATTDYHAITDAPTVAFNEAFVEELRQLRMHHEFDVFSLNYALPGSAGDALRAYCRTIDAQHGYLSWQSNITLDHPPTNAAQFTRFAKKGA